MKLFIDDFESAIRGNGHADFELTESAENEMISNYLRQAFTIYADQKTLHWDFVGFELRGDAVLCYMEIKKIKDCDEIQIESKVLTELFADQVNLTHFEYSGKIKSIKTTVDQPSGIIDISDLK